MWPFRKKPAADFPRKLETFFDNRECPDCGGDKWNCWEDGGHDVAIECLSCHACFGVQMPPFNLIERIPRRTAFLRQAANFG